jgi:hypothetical protein
MPDLQIRNLTPPPADQGPRRWISVGGVRAHLCTFCGRPSSAIVGCPDDGAPILWQVGVCDDCLTDCVMRRFSEVKYQRTVALADDMSAAADEIVKLRNDVWRSKLVTPPTCAQRSYEFGKSTACCKTRRYTTSAFRAAHCYDARAR